MVADATGACDCLVGRLPELAVLEEFLGSDACASMLVFTGGPGIGKTALWEAGLRRAREHGIRVLVARPSEAEAKLCDPNGFNRETLSRFHNQPA